jgi:hypothetical protein
MYATNCAEFMCWPGGVAGAGVIGGGGPAGAANKVGVNAGGNCGVNGGRGRGDAGGGVKFHAFPSCC